jgi:cytoskeletal protein RodZ
MSDTLWITLFFFGAAALLWAEIYRPWRRQQQREKENSVKWKKEKGQRKTKNLTNFWKQTRSNPSKTF